MTDSKWRAAAKEVIGEVFGECERAHLTTKRFTERLHAAYPFGQRAMHPYKVWCEEQRTAVALYAARRGETESHTDAVADTLADGLFAEAEA